MKHAHALSVLLFATALMSRPAAGNDTPGGTMIISAETICAQAPNSDFCRGQPAAGAQYGTALPPYPVPATGKAVARQSMPHAPSIQALEARAPWMDGYVRWCDAFPQHASC